MNQNLNHLSIRTKEDFYNQIVEPNYKDFLEDNSSPRYAINSLISSYHMHEWMFGKKFKVEEFEVSFPEENEVKIHLEAFRLLANGIKHFRNTINTSLQAGFESVFEDCFEKPLNYEIGGNSFSMDRGLELVNDFWRRQITSH